MQTTKQHDELTLRLFRDAFEAVTGHRICSNTASRYRNNGVRGVKLRAERRCGKWYTCTAWVREFIDASSQAPLRSPRPVAKIRKSTRAAARDSGAANVALQKMGA